jgi:hypothetical protein
MGTISRPRTGRFVVCMLTAALFVSALSGVWAGVEPTPWTPATNILNSMTNVLGQVDSHLVNILKPPNPNKPPTPNMVNELDALTMQLEVLSGRAMAVSAMLPAVQTPPDDFLMALDNVRTAAEGIVDEANAAADETNNLPYMEREALLDLSAAATDLLNNLPAIQ